MAAPFFTFNQKTMSNKRYGEEPVRYKDSKYLIYKDGRVFSEITNSFLSYGRYKKYEFITLCIDKVRVTATKHRLIAICYIPNPRKLRSVRHLNDDSMDNSISNLAWGTGFDNFKDAQRNGIQVGAINPAKGINHPKAKLTESQVYEIRYRYDDGERCIDLSKIFGVRPDQICVIGKRKQWVHLPEKEIYV
jgi:hypothetical protein